MPALPDHDHPGRPFPGRVADDDGSVLPSARLPLSVSPIRPGSRMTTRARLPRAGQRLVFGKHRLPADDQVCSAWPDLDQADLERQREWLRWIGAAVPDLPVDYLDMKDPDGE